MPGTYKRRRLRADAKSRLLSKGKGRSTPARYEQEIAENRPAPDPGAQAGDGQGKALFVESANAAASFLASDRSALEPNLRSGALAIQVTTSLQKGDMNTARRALQSALARGGSRKALGRLVATSAHISLSRAWDTLGNSTKAKAQKDAAVDASPPAFGAWLQMIEAPLREKTADALTIPELYRSRKGKVSDKWSSYLPRYQEMFSRYRELPINILEIGVQNGGSLEVWSEYFPNARHIVGCDIDPACADLEFDDRRIKVVVGDANDPATLKEILQISSEYNIIIDDGAHTSESIKKAFVNYFPFLAFNGLYVVEDLHCSYWPEYGGGLKDPDSANEFFKVISDFVNSEHWRVSEKEGLALLGEDCGWDLSSIVELLSLINSISSCNSMVTIVKKRSHRNILGKRVVRGQVAEVCFQIKEIVK